MTFESWKSSVVEASSANTAADKSYRCYFTNVDDRIQSFAQIACGDDAEATLKAQELLGASHLTSAELWQGKRLVGKWSNTCDGRWSNTGDAHRSRQTNGGGG